MIEPDQCAESLTLIKSLQKNNTSVVVYNENTYWTQFLSFCSSSLSGSGWPSPQSMFGVAIPITGAWSQVIELRNGEQETAW